MSEQGQFPPLEYGDSVYKFGALPMPDGYRVVWLDSCEHYIGQGPNEWETVITCSPHQARRWCIAKAKP